jgi:hypothetical protein
MHLIRFSSYINVIIKHSWSLIENSSQNSRYSTFLHFLCFSASSDDKFTGTQEPVFCHQQVDSNMTTDKNDEVAMITDLLSNGKLFQLFEHQTLLKAKHLKSQSLVKATLSSVELVAGFLCDDF